MSESNIQYNKRRLKKAVENAYYSGTAAIISELVDVAIDSAYEMAAMNFALTEADGIIPALTGAELDALVATVAMRRLPQPPPETAPRHREASE